MRTEYREFKTRRAAIKHMPWAAKILRVDGGYIGFESIADYGVWQNQK